MTLIRLEHLCSFISQIQRVLGQIQTLTHAHTHTTHFFGPTLNCQTDYYGNSTAKVLPTKCWNESLKCSIALVKTRSLQNTYYQNIATNGTETLCIPAWLCLHIDGFWCIQDLSMYSNEQKTSIDIIKSLLSACSQRAMIVLQFQLKGTASNWRRLLHSFSIESTHNPKEPMPIYST